MKKLSLFLALILVCTVLFASCGVEKPDNKDATDTSTQETEVSTTEVVKPLSPEEQKEHDAVQKIMCNLAVAETRDDVKPCVIQYSDEYADYVLAGLPEKDYIVEVKKVAEYKGALVYDVVCTIESDPEYIYSGVQLFSYTDDGELLIDLDEELVEQFCKDFVCDACSGQGYTIKKAQTSGGTDEEIGCEVCDGIGFDFDKVTE